MTRVVAEGGSEVATAAVASRIVVLGDVMVDVICRLSGPIAPGSDAPARIWFRGGGSAANVAAWLAAAEGPRTGGARGAARPRAAGRSGPVLVGRIGADERGRAAQAELEAAGVETALAVDRERSTGTCVVLVAPDGERSMVPDPGANDALAAGDLPDELLGAGRYLHVAGYALLREGSRPAARSAIERARAAGMSVSVDPSSAALLSVDFLDWVAGAGLLLPNADEAAVLSGEREPEDAARRLAERVPEVVVTLGAEGALWTDGREVCRAAAAGPANGGGKGRDGGGAIPPGVLDSTGAGDAFAAGFLAARLSGAGPEAALGAGCRLAAEAVRTPGARPARAACRVIRV